MKLETVILAAGSSSRMGQDKALLPVNGNSVLAGIINKLEPVSDNIYIIGGKNYAELIREFPDNEIIENENWPDGMFSSIKTGISACSENSWTMLQLIDQPFIRPETYRDLVREIDSNYLIIKPVLRELSRSGHPVLISPVVKKKIKEADIGLSLKKILHQIPLNKIKYIAVDDLGIIDNINTPEEFKKRIRDYYGNIS